MATKGSRAVVKSTASSKKKAASHVKKAAKSATAKTPPAHLQKGKKKVAPKKMGSDRREPTTYSAEELKAFKEMILAKRKETLDELDALKESMMDVSTGEYVSESSNYSLHMEQGTDAMEREKTFLFASRSSKYVNQLDDALARIDAKSYGVCRICGLLVPKERLEAVPTAQTCAEYKNTGMPCERGRIAMAKKKGA
ncbi:MAG TPA: TraR/DksA C4-type zinc finger protein [Bacteroidota bacterium]|nr:TraR/DksA C4-type zinc finger protein [Bacteroidota bacterium]